MRIFVSYASEDRELADQVQLSLTGRGHAVFFDRDSLPPGGDYHERIREAVEQSDLFVFLISSNSLTRGSYALTELKYARGKWRHPKGAVLPVLVEQVPWESIPGYLKAVTVLQPEGSVPAEVLFAVRSLETEQGVIQSVAASARPSGDETPLLLKGGIMITEVTDQPLSVIDVPREHAPKVVKRMLSDVHIKYVSVQFDRSSEGVDLFLITPWTVDPREG